MRSTAFASKTWSPPMMAKSGLREVILRKHMSQPLPASSSGWMWVSVKKTKSKWAGAEVFADHAVLGDSAAAAVVRAADFRNVRRSRGIGASFGVGFSGILALA